MSDKWQRRENKRNSQKNRMPKHGMSLFIIEQETRKRAERAKTIELHIIRRKKKSGTVPDSSE